MWWHTCTLLHRNIWCRHIRGWHYAFSFFRWNTLQTKKVREWVLNQWKKSMLVIFFFSSSEHFELLVVHFCVVCVSIYQSIKDSIDQFKPILLPKYFWVKILAHMSQRFLKSEFVYCMPLSELLTFSYSFPNLLASFNQTWHKVNLYAWMGFKFLQTKGQAHMQEDIIDQLQKFAECTSFKIFLPRTIRPKITKLMVKASLKTVHVD